MTEKRVIFESEEEYVEFCNICGIDADTIDRVRRNGFIRKNPVEEAEEMYNKYNPNSVKDDEEYILIEKLYSAIQYLKEWQK